MEHSELPGAKQTALGLYVTAHEAYKRWQAAPTTVKVLDVRTPEEFIFVGHPEMAVNVPLGFQTYRWDPAKGYFDFELNPDFVALVRQVFEPGDEILAGPAVPFPGRVRFPVSGGGRQVAGRRPGAGEMNPEQTPSSANH